MSKFNLDYTLDYSDMEVLPLKINEENRTPVEVAAKMVQSLDEWTSGEIFANPDYKFLDINSKSGVFLVLIYNKLMRGLKDVIEDAAKRSEHILANMLYGISPCIDAALISRMSIYCNFLNKGNIYQIDGLTSLKGKELEDKVKGALKDMKFDVVIGNPPYNRGMDIDFVNLGYELSTKFTCMITPAKWQTAEADQKIASKMSYGEFRKKLVPHMSHVVFYPCCKDVFDIYQTDGITYFLLDKQRCIEKAEVINKCNDIAYFNSSEHRCIYNSKSLLNIGNRIIESLGSYDSFSFNNISASHRYRVVMNSKVSGFDWYVTDKPRYVLSVSRVLDTTKGDTYEGEAKTVFSSNSLDECKSFISWIYTRFTRFFLVPNISKLNNIQTDHCFRFVPAPAVLDKNGNRVPGKFDHIYTDEELYKTFNLPQEYIDVIEAVIKERK